MSVQYPKKERYGIDDLIEIMKILRGEDGCPWDREQDHKSIRNNFLEETYEVLDAIDRQDPQDLCEELGDVMLQVVFHSRMEEEAGGFDFGDVCDGICKKLIIRHPHVFSTIEVSGSEEVLSNWDKIKQKTKGQTTAAQTLRSVSAVFPSLMRSGKVQHRAAKAGFDYPNVQWAINDLKSEMDELEQAIAQQDKENIQEELGDLLFSVVNISRFVGVDAEESLAASCEKFIRRFEQVEEMASQQEINMKESSIEQLDELWKQAKKKL